MLNHPSVQNLREKYILPVCLGYRPYGPYLQLKKDMPI